VSLVGENTNKGCGRFIVFRFDATLVGENTNKGCGLAILFSAFNLFHLEILPSCSKTNHHPVIP
jgi:hypothetical protein